jgi:menaquinone-9 beta-reductase
MTDAPMKDIYDVAIVGAGPSGATCAFYLARHGRRVALLDREQFPRDKLCGDAICGNAQVHLKRMGVLQQILDNNEGHWAAKGGFYSPRGLGFIGDSAGYLGSSLVIAVKRIYLDVRVARAAATAGVELIERFYVERVEFSAKDGCWSVYHRAPGERPLRARVLVIADGALSRLARSLGLVNTPPDGVCSRAYTRSASTNFDADGVLFYPASVLPGYAAMFREARGEMNYCVYIIPGGKCGVRDLKRMHHGLMKSDPNVRAALGPNPDMDAMRGSPLRLGGIARSYADHLMVIGDAAGHIDPLTGEGIQYAMDGAEIAANALEEAFAENDLSARSMRRYHERWRAAFGRDFDWSARAARMCARYPMLLDAGAALMQRKGTPFLAEWGEVMTGAKSKSHFLQPRIAMPLLWEVTKRWLAA